ncbi:hypothetical protein AYI68_g5282 [Smittium mucronatum]|uniref:Uncharacterized protein n=1 Tax=Smittium mucronatum TaxID=133383 RepID=A0A1R0GUR1_9FUNG|nr:hypothetical protein AYI68_g5282 [Smittium mucronatum]
MKTPYFSYNSQPSPPPPQKKDFFFHRLSSFLYIYIVRINCVILAPTGYPPIVVSPQPNKILFVYMS